MVDADVEIKGIIEKGKLLTLTMDEALKLKLADFRADTLDALLQQLGLAGAEVRRTTPNWAEEVVRFLTHPIVSSLLVTIGMLGIILELRTAGFGIAGILGISSFALFFWGHWLVQLAGWEELLMVAAGLTLLAVELFVIPGFGIAGVLGIVILVSALVLSLVGAGATQAFVLMAIGRVVFALLIAVALAVVILRALPRSPWGRRLVLETDLEPGEGYGAPAGDDRRWLGKTGRAVSTLQLAGIAEIDGVRVEVVSDDELIEPGTAIEVTRLDGGRIVVRRAAGMDQEPTTTRSEK
jgi:membrane-bound serine protease (ClpP class)